MVHKVLLVIHLLVQEVQSVLREYKVLGVQLVQMVQQERKVLEALLVPQVLVEVLVQTLQLMHLMVTLRLNLKKVFFKIILN